MLQYHHIFCNYFFPLFFNIFILSFGNYNLHLKITYMLLISQLISSYTTTTMDSQQIFFINLKEDFKEFFLFRNIFLNLPKYQLYQYIQNVSGLGFCKMHFFHLLFCQIYVEIYFCLPYLHLVYLYINIFFYIFCQY